MKYFLLFYLILIGCSFAPTGAVETVDGRIEDADGAINVEDANRIIDAVEIIDANGTDANGTDANGTDANGTDAALCQGYTVRSSAKTWHQAEVDCISSLGGHLVSVESAAENAIVRGLSVGSIHIGLRRENGSFTNWTNGTPLTHTNWFVGEGLPFLGEDCGQMAGDGRWYDADCGSVLNYICECT